MNQNCSQNSVSWAQNIPKMRLRPGIRPGPHWGSLQRSSRPLAGFRGPLRGGGGGNGNEGRKGGERKGKRGERKGMGGEGQGV